LPYAFDALEPSIDKLTMEIHHDRHHKAYVDNLNKALASSPDLLSKDIYSILKDIGSVPEKIRQAVINNGGGHANHTMFWEIMCPADKSGEPDGDLAAAIKSTFGDLAKLQEAVNAAARPASAAAGRGWSSKAASSRSSAPPTRTARISRARRRCWAWTCGSTPTT
jgi:Fe-Mn family superoxide dismutase